MIKFGGVGLRLGCFLKPYFSCTWIALNCSDRLNTSRAGQSLTSLPPFFSSHSHNIFCCELLEIIGSNGDD